MVPEEIRHVLTSKLTVSVVEAGIALGLSRNTAYAAAKRGEIPTLKFGSKLVVPTVHLRRLLGLNEREVA